MCETGKPGGKGLAADGSGRVHIQPGPLLGSPRLADAIVDQTVNVAGRVVVVDLRWSHHTSVAFMDRLIQRLLDEGAREVQLAKVVGKSEITPVVEAAAARTADARVRVVPSDYRIGLGHSA
jgi:hypothetical protein